ncbi:esterase/lipase [Mycolicibacterium aurum]|uniref:Esterase/lipase n=1 Tax=Mycolicibacterium aurum TaxID=1791 RepID=A0A3S4T6C2_MYCAU|nr:hypothetical protein [Mycolicibacterium aurum]VEG51923.1 esterase/lipase [Mycolicibacterium aurum]
MIDRLTVLLGAGVITVGVSAGLLAGAGVAVATTESGTAGATTTSESSDSGTKERSGSDTDADSAETDTDAPSNDTDADDTDADDTDVDADADDAGDADGDTAIDTAPETAAGGKDEDTAPDADADQGEVSDTAADPGTDIDDSDAAESIQPSEPSDPSLPAEPAEPTRTTSVDTTVAVPQPLAVEPTTVVEPLATMTAADAATQSAATPPRQTLLSLIGAVIFNLYSVAIQVLGGPPQLPAGSSVTVKSSTLRIDCGQGYDVPADWYVPEGATPTRLIYFQHGFMAAGPFYSYTAARLAEATHSIVVTTSLTSNFLACDGCWVGGSPMHKAVADLFVDGNTALAQSALAAGYSSTLLDGIEKIGLTGHSAGGGLAAGAAGYMTQNGTFGKLAGVVMLDGVGFGDVTPEALAKLPQDFPIYNLAARAYYWNLSGTTNTSMEAWRPGGFNGVKLTNSSHGDAMSGGNPFVQIAMNLVTGWPKPANVDAAEKISAAWFNDMFTGTPPSPESGYYGTPGSTLEFDTTRGTATAYVLPGPVDRQTLLDWLFTFAAKIVFGIDFATCADDPSPNPARIAELPRPNTALSLDGRAKAGQSIGQQCVHG